MDFNLVTSYVSSHLCLSLDVPPSCWTGAVFRSTLRAVFLFLKLLWDLLTSNTPHPKHIVAAYRLEEAI